MNKKLIALALAAGVLLGAHGENIKWRTSASSAFSEAKSAGKLILMICGRKTCGNTMGTRDYTCEEPEVRAVLDGYVPWFCNCDTQQDDFWQYITDKGAFALSLVCVINPSVPNKYVGRSFGYMDPSRMLSFLKANGPKKVKFDANGGEVTEQERTVLPLSAIGKLPTPKRGKYTFTGWYTKQSGGTKISASTKIKSSATYYAYWAAPWTVTFNLNGGVLGEGETNKVQVARGKAVGTLLAPTKTGYKLKGWYTKKSGGTKITTKTKVTKNITWYAQWTPRSYPVAVTKDGKGGTVSGTGSKAYKSTVTLKATAASGYVFQGWYLDGVLKSRKTSYAFKVPLNGVTYTAKFITKAEDRAGIGMSFEGVGVGGGLGETALPAVTNVCGVVTTWPVAATGLTPVSVSVTGLPKGMKYDAKKKAITGVATVTKSGTMKITVKSAGANRTWSVKWRTVALPTWATGTFKGTLYDGDGTTKKGTVTLTVGKTGKVSGKFVNVKKTSYAFSVGSFKSFEAGVLRTKATMKYGTKSVALEIAVGLDSGTSAGFAEVGSTAAPFSGHVAVLKK